MNSVIVLSRVGVTNKTGFGLDDWIYCTLYIHTFRVYSAIIILHTFQFNVAHTLGFSVFTSRVLATGFSQSHCNFKSHMKSSLQSPIPFLSHLPSHLGLSSPELDPVSFPLLFCTPCYSASSTPALPNTSDNHFVRTPRKIPSSIVKNICFLVRYLATDVLFSRARVLQKYVYGPVA
jgi:hypothetical protein